MKISQHVGWMLSGAVAFNSWLPARAQDAEAKPNWPTAPLHEAPPKSWPEPPKAPAQCAQRLSSFSLTTSALAPAAAFGGPIYTPNFERLANAGLRYNSFHMNALCSPTRAALLTGRNNHQVGFGSIAEWSAPIRLQHHHSAKRRHNRRDPEGQRLLNLGLRQVAQHAHVAGEPRRPIRSLASRTRLRALLRLHPGRRRSVLSAHLQRQRAGRAWQNLPKRATTSPPTLPITPSSGCISTTRWPTISPSSSTTPPALRTSPTRFLSSGSNTTAGALTAAGM